MDAAGRPGRQRVRRLVKERSNLKDQRCGRSQQPLRGPRLGRCWPRAAGSRRQRARQARHSRVQRCRGDRRSALRGEFQRAPDTAQAPLLWGNGRYFHNRAWKSAKAVTGTRRRTRQRWRRARPYKVLHTDQGWSGWTPERPLPLGHGAASWATGDASHEQKKREAAGLW